jgi:hypothetical protein
VLAAALVGRWLVDSARDEAYDRAEARLTGRSHAAGRLIRDLMFDVQPRLPLDQEEAERCGLGGGANAPVTTFVVVDGEGSVACDESGGYVDDPEALGRWVAANAHPHERTIAIDVPGARQRLVDIAPLDDRWVVGVRYPPTIDAWIYLDVRYGFLVDPDGPVIAEWSAIDVPEVAAVPDDDVARIESRERGVGELLAMSSRVVTSGGWRVVVATAISDIDAQARRQWGPALVVLAVVTVLGLVVLTAAVVVARSRLPRPPAPVPASPELESARR